MLATVYMYDCMQKLICTDMHSRDVVKTEFVSGGGLSFGGGAVTLALTPRCLSDHLLSTPAELE